MNQDDDPATLADRVRQLEARAAADRAELDRLKQRLGPFATEPPPPEPPPPPRSLFRDMLSLAVDALLLLAGTAAAFGILYAEFSLHWALAAVLAPLGGVLFWMLGRLGAVIMLIALLAPLIGSDVHREDRPASTPNAHLSATTAT